MKRLICLKIDLSQIADDLSKAKFAAQETQLMEQAVKEFKKQVKKLKPVKVVKDYLPKPQVLIEFDDEQYQTIYEALCKMDVVEIIDSIITNEG
jgi:hypothetical protein